MVSTDLQTHMVSLSEIVPYAGNAKEHPEWQVDQLASSIEKFGNCDPIAVWHNQRGQPEIVEGHGRLMALEKLGYEEAPVIFLDHLTDEQRRAYALVHNQLTMNTGFDMETLESELSKIFDIDMEQFDFEIVEPDDEEDDLEPIEADEDELPEISPTRSKTGQIWALGDHRLVCGDSTDRQVVDALMGEEKADLLLTDPPYNVDVGYCERPHSGNNGIHIMNDNMEQGEFVEFLTKAMENADSHMREGAAFYVFYAGLHHAEFAGAVDNVESLGIHEQLVWVKSHFAMGRNSDYQWMHECCLYGWKKGANRYFCDSRKEATVIEDEDVKLSTMKKDDLIELCERLLGLDKASTVLRAEKPNAAELHPTVKPQRLLTYLVRNSSRRGETVLDLFCGSGSTIIACEQMGRRCRAVELDPHYADVTIERWERFTGKSAELIGMVDGQAD